MKHPVLRKPGRLEAFADLRANPVGTLESWAARWGGAWKKDAVHRFLHALMRARLIDFVTTPYGTTVTFLDVGADPSPARADRELNVDKRQVGAGPTRDESAMNPRRVRDASAKPLASLASGSTWPSGKFSTTPTEDSVDVIAYGGTEGSYTEKLIRAMNRACTETLGSSFRQVKLDNYGSKSAGEWLEELGIPVEFAIEKLVRAARSFNLGKHGKGSPPKTVAYFKDGIVEKWRQYELRLLSVDSAAAEQLPPPLPVIPPAKNGDEGAPATDETIAAAMQEFRQRWSSL